MMNQALALLEFDSVAAGVLAVDRMLKQAPIALLRCGSVHPGRYLALVGGSVAGTEEAHAAGVRSAGDQGALTDEILLPDPHPLLTVAITGARAASSFQAKERKTCLYCQWSLPPQLNISAKLWKS